MNYPVKQYLAVENFVLPRPGVILKGAYLDSRNRSLWHDCENYKVTNLDEWVRAGSLFEVGLAKWHERALLRSGFIATSDTKLHFNLEMVFQPQFTETLRAHGITVLEDVSNEIDVQLSMSELGRDAPQIVSMRQFLAQIGTVEEVEHWIKSAKEVVADLPPDSPTLESVAEATQEE